MGREQVTGAGYNYINARLLERWSHGGASSSYDARARAASEETARGFWLGDNGQGGGKEVGARQYFSGEDTMAILDFLRVGVGFLMASCLFSVYCLLSFLFTVHHYRRLELYILKGLGGR